MAGLTFQEKWGANDRVQGYIKEAALNLIHAQRAGKHSFDRN
jgi:hypothetical protein